MADSKLFDHAMLMSGGSSRFGYYLGMYAAAKQQNKAPDLILATCGGAIAAGIIACFSDVRDQKLALLSEEMHAMQKRIVPKESLTRALMQIIFRLCQSSPVTKYPDFYEDAIFSILNDMDNDFFPFDHGAFNSNPNTSIAIIGSKLHYTPKQVHQRVNGNTLFQEVVFSTPEVVQEMMLFDYSSTSQLIHSELYLPNDASLAKAIRASVGDIFYAPPFEYRNDYYMGGMVNLVPFEYAQYLAKSTTLECKQTFNRLTAVPAFQQVLGFNPNRRLAELHRQQPTRWVDTRDSATALRQFQSKKRVQWLKNCVDIKVPSYANYRVAMEKQWQYGFERGLRSFLKENSNETYI